MQKGWSFVAVRLTVVVTLSAAIGFAFHQVLVAILLALLGYLGLDLFRLYRLTWWLQHRSSEDPPDFHGPWGEAVALIMRIYRRKQFHKRRITQLFREFRHMSTAVPDGILVLGRDREIQWFTRSAGRLLGLRRKMDFGQRIDNLVRQPDFLRYLAGRDYSVPVTVRSSVDTECYLNLQLVVYSSERKLLLVRDVTREMRVEAMRKDFVANASHELRSPLTVISGYVDTLAEDTDLDPVWTTPLAEMGRQAARMRSVVDSLIELSRLESTSGEAGTDAVDVPGMLALLKREALSLDRRPHEVTLALASNAKLLGAEMELHSVFGNLISNAIKYTPPEGRVDIRWWTDDAGAHFSVSDTGIGIPSEHLPRLTERFYRVDASRHRATGGSGLGLAIVKHALTRHGGTLEVRSVEGKGSVFTCHFPKTRVGFL